MKTEPGKVTAVDVAVLGAGPAGCAAALSLAREHGRRVVLIDRLPARPRGPAAAASLSPGSRVAGETLPPAARAPLEALGLWERFASAGHLPSPGILSAWGGQEPVETDFLFHSYGCGWHLDRAAFGRMLRDAAEEAGARLLVGTRLLAAERRPRGGGWELTLGPTGEVATAPAPERLRTHLVIVATGRALPAELPLPPLVRERVALDRLVAVAVRLTSRREAREDGSDPRLLLEATPGGWWYVAPLPGRARTAVFLTDTDLIRARGGAAPLWRKALAEAPLARRHSMADSPEIGKAAAVAAQSYCRGSVAGPDFLLTGDAACAWDPLTGQGLRRALEEGRGAALAAAARLESPDAEPLRDYAARVRASWGTYVRRRAEVYGAERRWESEPFWRRRHISGVNPAIH
jgi:flavin-dependent dehydrogenase